MPVALGALGPWRGRAEPAARRLSGGFPRSALALPSPVPRGVPSPCASRLLVAPLPPSAMAQPSADTFGSCRHLRVQNSEEPDPALGVKSTLALPRPRWLGLAHPPLHSPPPACVRAARLQPRASPKPRAPQNPCDGRTTKILFPLKPCGVLDLHNEYKVNAHCAHSFHFPSAPALTSLRNAHPVSLQKNAHSTCGRLTHSFFRCCLKHHFIREASLPSTMSLRSLCYFVIQNPVLSSYNSYHSDICVCILYIFYIYIYKYVSCTVFSVGYFPAPFPALACYSFS